MYNGNVSKEFGRPRAYTPGSPASIFEIQNCIMYCIDVGVGSVCLILLALLQNDRHMLLFCVKATNVTIFPAVPVAVSGVPISLSYSLSSLSPSVLRPSRPCSKGVFL